MKKIALEEHFWTEGFPHTGKLGADLFQPGFLRAIEAGKVTEATIDAALSSASHILPVWCRTPHE